MARRRDGIGSGRALLAVGCSAVLLAACTTTTPSVPAAAPRTTTIPQPPVKGLTVAPAGARVDVARPTFSNPTEITNPLFPVSSQESVLMLGRVEGKAFRTEVTLLPFTRIIEWDGVQVETLVSQYTAYLDGRIEEVAYDHYAQDDAGAVWYFGEDVYNFADGVIVDTHGTWLAGKDGPAAMIMPADPKVGDVYRPENTPGFVFEEVTVGAVDETLAGPLGPVEGGVRIVELHMDGGTEGKTFAPGYGEFYTAADGEVEALVLAIPTDALPGPLPASLTTLKDGALSAFEAARAARWSAAASRVRSMRAAWASYPASDVPDRLAPRMDRSLSALSAGVRARDVGRSSRAAIQVAQSALDLQLRYRPATEVDVARFDLWCAQLIADAAARDAASVNGDAFTLDYIRDRILHAVDGAAATRINSMLEALQTPLSDGDLAGATRVATKLRATIAGL